MTYKLGRCIGRELELSLNRSFRDRLASRFHVSCRNSVWLSLGARLNVELSPKFKTRYSIWETLDELRTW